MFRPLEDAQGFNLPAACSGTKPSLVGLCGAKPKADSRTARGGGRKDQVDTWLQEASWRPEYLGQMGHPMCGLQWEHKGGHVAIEQSWGWAAHAGFSQKQIPDLGKTCLLVLALRFAWHLCHSLAWVSRRRHSTSPSLQ